MDIIPDEVKEKYKIHEEEHNGYFYMELRKGMYGLSQAGILANNLLTKRLASKGYRPYRHTPGFGDMIGDQ
eukprot:11667764-Ditylum_brightwellii.AAC.1